MGQPDNPRIDFIDRTVANLRFIQKARQDRDREGHRDGVPYEFTQLVNSFLMAFIHPKEEWIKQLDDTRALPAPGWPVVNTELKYRKKEPKNLRELVEKLRNALAHGNFEVIPNAYGLPLTKRKIAWIRLWNTPKSGKSKTIWETTINIDDLQKILDAFVLQIQQIAAKERA